MGRVLPWIKSLLALVWVHSGLLRLVHRLQGPRILVLAYHRVTPDDALPTCAYPAMHVSISSFERQLEAVRDLYRIIPMHELKQILLQGEPLREPVAVITFDDGYRDNFKNAFPILQRMDIPATFFLSFGFVDREDPFWFDRLAQAAAAWEHQVQAREALRQVVPTPVSDAFDAPMPLQERCRTAAAHLKTLADDERRQVMATLVNALQLQGETGDAHPMSWDEARQMSHEGMTIGAHSVSHAILTSQPENAARDEISASLDGVARRLGLPVDTFAYPNGDTDETVTTLVQEAGGAVAFTMEPRQNRVGDAALRLGRYNVCEDTSRSAWRSFSRAWFWCEITGFFDVVLRRNQRRVSGA